MVETPLSTVCYGRDLWDCLQILTDSTHSRTLFMKSLSRFFLAYKKSLEVFSLSLSKATTQFDKDLATLTPKHKDHDTLIAATEEVKKKVEEMGRELGDKGERIGRDLVEPLDLYYKHYSSTN